MASIKLATWNINSVRLRADLVGQFLTAYSPDVLCLQETKVPDALFPGEVFTGLGYVHQAINGQKGYHGVAILSRLPFRKTAALSFCGKDDTRHVSAVLEAGLQLHNFYVPAGGDTPDRSVNPKFGQKLDFIGRMTRWAEKLDRPTLIVGDFNVAPLDCDVYDHKALLKVVSHTPVEIETLGLFKDAHGWVDLGREFIPAPDRNYTWWSYRAFWRDKDQGRRLDHMWASPDLAGHAKGHRCVEETRRWEQPSDHVPVVTEFTF